MTELIVELVVVVVLLLVVSFLLRRRFLLSGLGAVTMWLRSEGAPRWSVGVAWYGGDSLLWYRALSLSVRPQHRFCRSELRVEEGRRAGSGDLALPHDLVVLSCATGSGRQDLAMDAGTVPGFLSWLESAPPGAGSSGQPAAGP